jgi:beta-lactamase class A
MRCLTPDMRKKFVIAPIFFAVAFAACRRPLDIPSEFPTPQPPAAAKPVPKLQYKRDVGLESEFATIAEEAKGRVGVAAVVLETGDGAFLKGEEHFPMQSVYKLPIAMAVMEQAKLGRLDLEEKVAVTREDFVRRDQHSPLRDENPDGGEFTIRELIWLALSESDGTAPDVLLRVLGGPAAAQSYLTQIGVTDIKIVNTEKDLNWQTQYDNWATPEASAFLIQSLCAQASGQTSGWNCPPVPPVDNLSSSSDQLKGLLYAMSMSTPGRRRLKGSLPAGTIVAHKTGTGGTRNDIAAATNDIGLIYLHGGRHLAIAVFVSDSPADERTREGVIAKIAKAAWDRWQQ